MNRPILFAAGVCAIALLPPLELRAQNGTENYYNPPKLVKAGMTKTALAGGGTVVVQVFVKADGTFTVSRILRSTNHGDDAAAREIASTSSYKAATRGGKPQSAYYDYTLRFSASGARAAAPAASGGVAEYEREIRAGNYSAAQASLKTYVSRHPADQKAQLDLGVANTYLNDSEGGVAAFDQAGTIPDNYKAIAAKAYADYTAQAIKNKDFTKAVAAAKKSAALSPGAFTSNALGTAEDAAGDSAAAVADLEKARASATGLKPAERARIDANLVSAYLDAGKPDMARQIAAESTQLDPSETSSQLIIANYYAKQAQDATTGGKFSEAASLYEQAAAAAPSQAVSLYGRAAISYLQAQPKPENDKAKADADKALALDPNDSVANFAAGISLANQGKNKDALAYLDKADTAAKKTGDTKLIGQIESSIKQLNAAK